MSGDFWPPSVSDVVDFPEVAIITIITTRITIATEIAPIMIYCFFFLGETRLSKPIVSAFIGSPPIKISEFSAIYEYILYK